MNANPFGYCDENARRLSGIWIPLKITATSTQKDAVGLAFIAHVLNLGDDVAQRFAAGDWNAIHEVGMRQGNAYRYVPNLRRFWERIQEIFPNLHTPRDIDFLVGKCEVLGALHFMFHLDSCLAPPCQGAWSKVLRDLSVNATAYK